MFAVKFSRSTRRAVIFALQRKGQRGLRHAFSSCPAFWRIPKPAPHCNAFCFRTAFSAASNNAVQPPEVVDFDHVQQLVRNKECNLVDVREPHELRKEGAIPTAVNIPLGEITAAFALSENELRKQYKLNGVRSKHDNVIFFCRAGIRAMDAAFIAQQLGYVNAKCYKGSILDWNARTAEHASSNK